MHYCARNQYLWLEGEEIKLLWWEKKVIRLEQEAINFIKSINIKKSLKSFNIKDIIITPKNNKESNNIRNTK